MYEKIIDKKEVYRQKVVKLPTPELIVLYNGKAPFPTEKMLKLSDAFIETPKQTSCFGSVELTVRVLNINAGYNDEIINRSDALRGYVTFMGKIRENVGGGMVLAEAIAEAVKYCTQRNMIKPFLEKHASEVDNMLSTEFVLADAIEVWKEEGREEGREEIIKQIMSLLESGKSVEEIKAAISH